MKIQYGLISADSHIALDRDAFTKRMSKTTWGDRIPQVVETTEKDKPVERWIVSGKIRRRAVCNCPAAMDGPLPRNKYPDRWEEVPRKAYVPQERLNALDEDRIDAEVLFPNDPGGFYDYKDAAFELACVQAYNDALSEWHDESDRFIPLAMVPLLGESEARVAEVKRAVTKGHRGIVMLAEPSSTVPGFKHISDPYWYPLWAVCEELGVPVHIHASAGLGDKLAVPRWEGYTPRHFHSAFTTPCGAWPAQLVPNLIFSGVLGRFPQLKWVFAETGIGSINYVREACDYEWERRRLWTDGFLQRPSEIVTRQIFVNFWFERSGIQMRHQIGIDNIMWESDYPHISSTYPQSWDFVSRTVEGVPAEEQKKLLWENAARLYGLM